MESKPVISHEHAMELFNARQLDQALSIYKQLLALNETDAQAWHMAGAIAAMSGDYAAARSYSEQAIQLSPNSYGPYINLAKILQASGDLQGAMLQFSRALEIKPRDPEILTGIAGLHAMLGDYPQAESCLQDVIQNSPGYTFAYNALGNIYREMFRLDAAAVCFQQAILMQPDYVDAICNLGAVLIEQLKFEDAELSYKTALKYQPDNPLIHYGLGNLYQSLGKFELAKECYLKASALGPSNIDIRSSLASLHERCGERESAFELLDPLMKQGNYGPDAAITYAKVCRNHAEYETAVSALNACLKTSRSPGKVIDIYFSLGELYDQYGKYQEAFACFKKANDLDSRPASQADYPASVRAITTLYSKQNWPALPRSTILSELPVFIVGMPRTGTSLVEQILASHPQVCPGGERNDIFTVTDSLMSIPGYGKDLASSIASVTTPVLDRLAAEYLDSIKLLCKGESRFTDKTPLHGILLGFINQLLPGSRVIICHRDPMDTCLSIYFHRFNAYHGYATRLDSLGHFFKAYYKLMDHWANILDIKILQVHYEELVREPTQSIRNIINFCGLDWDEKCLSFHNNRRTVNTPSYNQVRRPIYTDSVERWKHYSEYLEPLRIALNS